MRRPISLVTIVLAALLLVTSIAVAQDGDVPLVELGVKGSPLITGSAERLEATVKLSAPADLRLRVTDFDGRPVRELYTGSRRAGSLTRGWRGRDDDGQTVPSGPYRIRAVATADGATERADAWVTLADRAVYPRRPDFITIAVDPGHGGRLSGATGVDGTREADLNLDIGLRLARMLEGAGVNVAITRTSDAFVNEPPEDRTGDGVIDDDDELAARPDVANKARADVFVSVHNNNAVSKSVGGPSTLYFDERSFGARSARLASLIQEEMVRALAGAVDGDWEPYDHGTIVYPYYVLRGFDPPRLRRPTQMPGVLSEGMFLSNERELRLLKRPAVRGAMAVGYYDAIARYLAKRSTHVGYQLIDAPVGPIPTGDTVTYTLEVRNQGQEVMRGWRLRAEAVRAPERYPSRLRDGTRVGGVRIPRLKPGKSAVVEVKVTAPRPGQEWMLLFDARDPNGRKASSKGSPVLQVRLETMGPPEPSPEPAASALTD
jgi:N-acetylmuramoyl-L-alanine amidase